MAQIICMSFGQNLTLTRVVFEFIKNNADYKTFKNLTLTRVVFEYFGTITMCKLIMNLTLTRVVFECLWR